MNFSSKTKDIILKHKFISGLIIIILELEFIMLMELFLLKKLAQHM